MLKLRSLIFIILLVFFIPLTAEEIQHVVGDLSIQVPSAWRVEQEGDSLLIQSPDENVIMALIRLEADNLQSADQQASDLIGDVFNDFELEYSGEETLNGMNAILYGGYVISGTMMLGYYVVETPLETYYIFLGVASLDDSELYEDEVEAISESIRPVE
ncbi:MAG: hypothetical protein APR63_06300 [Desulfuromonas sp. SDB]|nr:MAG: hypothetical protein APR63_06300 [Desulfuromonas sp. SDB]